MVIPLGANRLGANRRGPDPVIARMKYERKIEEEYRGLSDNELKEVVDTYESRNPISRVVCFIDDWFGGGSRPRTDYIIARRILREKLP